MPFHYRIDTCLTEVELEAAINYWAEQGYEPHHISTMQRKTKLGEMVIPVLILIVRKVVRKPRKVKV